MLRTRNARPAKTGRWAARDVKRVLLDLGFFEQNIEVRETLSLGGFEVTINTALKAYQEVPVSINAVLIFKQHKEGVALALQRLQMTRDTSVELTQDIHRFADLHHSELFVDSVSLNKIVITSGALFRKTRPELFS